MPIVRTTCTRNEKCPHSRALLLAWKKAEEISFTLATVNELPPFPAAERLAPSPTGGLLLGLPFSLALGLLLGLLLGLSLSLALGLLLGLSLSLALALLLGFFLYLPFLLPSGFLFRNTALLRRFSPCCYFPLLSDLALRSFFA